MRLRHLLPTLVCFALFAGSVGRAAEVEFVRVWTGWRDAGSFETISEYFTGHENSGRRIVLRTHPDARGGFYYLVRVANSGAAKPGAKFSVQVIAPDSPEPKTYTFPVDLAARTSVFQLGLTGPTWPDSKVHPVAWKLELLSANGQVLARANSFLWEKPAR